MQDARADDPKDRHIQVDIEDVVGIEVELACLAHGDESGERQTQR